VGLVGADDHVLDVGVGESRLLLLAGNPVAVPAPAQTGARREFAQLLHRHPVALGLLGLSVLPLLQKWSTRCMGNFLPENVRLRLETDGREVFNNLADKNANLHRAFSRPCQYANFI
jgi:hypothetical protein